MSTSTRAQGERRTVRGVAFGRPYERALTDAPPRRADLLAGAFSVVLCVLSAAPVGLAWGALAPRVQVLAVDAERANLVEVYGDARIAADARFLAAVLVAGFASGVVAQVLARRHAPAVVVGLAVGGLLAALTVARVGGQVGRLSTEQVLASVDRYPIGEPLALTASSAVVGWPLAALVAYLLLSLLRGGDG